MQNRIEERVDCAENVTIFALKSRADITLPNYRFTVL